MEQLKVRRLFDANADTYDRVNSIVSLGLDARWRDWAARRAVTCFDARVLDAFAGTGRVGLRAAELGARVTLADISPRMLSVASRRAREKGLSHAAVLTDLTAETQGVEGPFDALTVMWGLRYLEDPVGTLRRLAGLVTPGGRVIVVDFVEPTGGVITRSAAAYFFHVLPRIAGALAGQGGLYDELVATTHTMRSREHLMFLVREAGLEIVEQRTMGFGLVVGIVAVVPPKWRPLLETEERASRRSRPGVIILLDASALEQLDDQHDDGDDDQDVDEPAERGAGNESQQPQHEQYDEDGPEHR